MPKITMKEVAFILTCDDEYQLDAIRRGLREFIQAQGGRIPSEKGTEARLLGVLILLEAERTWWEGGYREELQTILDRAVAAAQARREDEAEENEFELPPRDGEPTLRRGR